MTLSDLAAMYRRGLTLRKIAAATGIHHTTVLYRLRRVPGFKAMVTRQLLLRAKAALEAFTITRTPEKRRRAKLTAAILRMRRPAVYARWQSSFDPPLPRARRRGNEWVADCPRCRAEGSTFARKIPAGWSWRCSSCEEEGRVPRGRMLPGNRRREWTIDNTPRRSTRR